MGWKSLCGEIYGASLWDANKKYENKLTPPPICFFIKDFFFKWWLSLAILSWSEELSSRSPEMSFVGLCITKGKKSVTRLKKSCQLGSASNFFPKIWEPYPMWFGDLHPVRDKLLAPSGQDSSAEILRLASHMCCSRPDTACQFLQWRQGMKKVGSAAASSN